MDSDKVERLRERLLQCAVCMDEYKDPRILPCHHTLCFECIENVVQATSNSGRLFRCPQCRSDVCVPRGGIQDLPINFYLISLQDELGTSGYSGSCDVCRRDWLATQFHCIDCDLDICRFCIHSHRLETHTEPPKILRIEPVMGPNQRISGPTCNDHPSENLQLFCSTCNRAICISCSYDSNHKRHTIIPMAVKLQQSQSYLQLELDRLTDEKRKLLKAGDDLEKTKEEVVAASNKALLAIDAAAYKACEVILSKKSQLVKEVLGSERSQTGNIDNVLQEFASYVQRIDRGLAFLTDLQDSDVCLEVVDTYKDFSHKLNAARSVFASKHIMLEKYHHSVQDWGRVYESNIGLSRKLIHVGSLGSLSMQRHCLTINPKTMTWVLKPRRFVQIIESHMFRVFFRFIIAFLFCQLFFCIVDASGVLGIIPELRESAEAQFWAAWLYMSGLLSDWIQLIQAMKGND